MKALLTIVCLGLRLRGGEIMPTFTVGALLGASCTVMTQGDPAFSAAVGLVAFFAAMSRCPVTAFLMGCEIFGWAGAPAFAWPWPSPSPSAAMWDCTGAGPPAF